ncbi:putative ribonuclease H-like domain-containing protein [Tanacetum coccineum]
MDVKSAFLYGKIKEEVYVCQPPGFEDPEFPDKVYKVEKALYGLHQAPRAWYETLSTYLLDNGFLRGQIDKTLFIKRIKSDILLIQVYVDDIIFGSTKKELCTDFENHDKYMDEILKKFGFSTVKTASTPMETSKPLLKDTKAEYVDVHLYRSMIGSLMYLTAFRPDIIFVVCACVRFQVTPKVSYLHAVKKIFRYLKGQPKLGFWYPKDSPFDLEAYTDSNYAGSSLDMKSTTGGCQFLRRRLISWQCKKQTIVVNSTTEAEYVAAASCCGQVIWIPNQMLDYGYNFMNTNIHIDNESTICIVKNPVFHSKTKHIEIRHHFIIDSNEKKLIQMIKIHTNHNVADLLTKAFDVGRFQNLIASMECLTPETATVRTVDNGEQEITAIVDGKEFTITEASVRRHLQLANVDGISVLPTIEIFDQLSLMGNMKRGFSREHTPLFPSMLAIQVEEEPIPNVVSSSHQKTQTPKQALNQVTELPQTSEPIPNIPDEVVYKKWDDIVEKATTTTASLDAEQASGSPRCQKAMGGSIAQTRSERVPTPPCDLLLPRVHTLRSDEGSMTLQEWKVLCTTLSKKVESLEADLKQTKQVYGVVYTKLIMKVKKLENIVKTSHSRRRAKIVVSDDEEDSEDSSKQGRIIEEIDQDAGVTLVTPIQGEDQPEDQLGVLSAAKVLVDAAKTNVHTYTRRRRAVSTGSGGISNAEESVSTAGASMPVSTAGMVQEVNRSIPSPVLVKDKGKGKMEESKDEQTKRTKLQQEQERLGHEVAVRLQEELDEEER